MKNQKGITLIALVITIIVLLILAAVSITSLTDEDKGVVTKAKEAAKKTDDAATQEDDDIEEILNYADEEIEDFENRKNIKTFYISMGEGLYPDLYYNAEGPLEDKSFFDPNNPSAPYTTTALKGFQYSSEMTWRDWLNSDYCPEDFVLKYVDGTHAGFEGDSITIASKEYEFATFQCGVQLMIHSVVVYYNDANCTSINSSVDIYGGAKYWSQKGINIDEKIDDTLATIKEEVIYLEDADGNGTSVYERTIPFLAFSDYENANF